MGKSVKSTPLAKFQHFLKITLKDQLNIETGKINVGKVVHIADAVQRTDDKVKAIAV